MVNKIKALLSYFVLLILILPALPFLALAVAGEYCEKACDWYLEKVNRAVKKIHRFKNAD